MKKNLLNFILAFFCFQPIYQPITAQFIIDGDIQNYNAVQTYSENELIEARNRLNIQLSRPYSFGELRSEIHIFNTYSDKLDFDIQIKELYLEFFTSNSDVRLGFQRLTTGRTDAGFVTDVYSGVDFRDFLTKEPDEIILGTLAVNIRRYFNQNSIQLLLSPIPYNSKLPGLNSRWFPIQSFDGSIDVNLIKESQNYSLSEFSGAISYSNRSTPNFDFDVKALYWNYPSPSFGFRFNNINNPQSLSLDLFETYEQSLMIGLSGQYRLTSSLFLNTEALFVQGRLFTFSTVPKDQLDEALNDPFRTFQVLQQFTERDDNYLKRKPWLHSMAGLQSDLFGYTISGQLYLEWILDYDKEILSRPLFPYATLLVTRSLIRERLQLSALNRFNFTGRDWLFQFQSIYEVLDGLEITLGANLMGGNEADPFYGHFSFNQYRDNSFIFSRITYYY